MCPGCQILFHSTTNNFNLSDNGNPWRNSQQVDKCDERLAESLVCVRKWNLIIKLLHRKFNFLLSQMRKKVESNKVIIDKNETAMDKSIDDKELKWYQCQWSNKMIKRLF